MLSVCLYGLDMRLRGAESGFVLGYGVVRFLIEFVRLPDAQLGYLAGGWLTMGQLLSVPLIVTGAVLLAGAFRFNRPRHIDWP